MRSKSIDSFGWRGMTSHRRRRPCILPIPHPRSHVVTRSAPRHRCSSRLRRRVLVSGNGRPREFGRVDRSDLAVEAESYAAKVKEGM